MQPLQQAGRRAKEAEREMKLGRSGLGGRLTTISASNEPRHLIGCARVRADVLEQLAHQAWRWEMEIIHEAAAGRQACRLMATRVLIQAHRTFRHCFY